MRRASLALLSAALLLAGCSGVGNRGSTDGYVSGDGTVTFISEAADREPAPLLEGTDLDDEPLSTADFAGTPMVINVWGSWCPPCRAEAPILAELDEQYADQVQFLGILNRTKNSAARAFNAKQGITYPSFADDSGRLELRFVDTLPSQAIPTTWVIDAEGRVAARVMGEVSASVLGTILDDLLAESAGGV